MTLLFTDIEGSTKLLDELGPERYRDALGEHRRLLRDAFARHSGYEVDYEGDAFFVAFEDAASGVAAALEGQAALSHGPIRVRMGLHTGEPLLDPPKYVGRDVHLAARVMSAGHGGQVLLSGATRSALGLSHDVLLGDLGEHRLKDFADPVWLFQLGEEPFPPLKTISNTNLPRPASSFVGREPEVAEVVALLRDGARLVTLSGPGGSGKTRLAIEAAAELVSEFRNGVFWVGLAAIPDFELVVPQVGQVLGANDGLAAHVGERELLLLLDNLEQVIEVAPELAALVETCPNLTLLVTSRELLRVRGEVGYDVPPLAEPDAVELFCTRAQLDPSRNVEELCRRLDNMPLALELAAARTKALTPEQILERLSQRLDLFRGGRDADARQQTLRATIEWSYDLLTEEEQWLFAGLAVFAGGCTLAAAEQVCDADLDTLQSLVEKSLVRRTGERFWMLETIREYAIECFDRVGGADKTRRHAEHFARLVEWAELGRSGVTWDDVVSDLSNVRAAIDFAAASGDHVLELSLLGLARPLMRDSVEQYRSRLENLLPRAEAASPRTRVRATGNLAFATYRSGDFEAALRFAEQELAGASDLADPRLVGIALNSIAAAKLALQDAAGARAALEEAGQLLEQAGDERTAAATKVNLADVLLFVGDYAEAGRLCDEALPAFERARDPDGRVAAMANGATASVLAAAPDAKSRVAEFLAEVRSDDEYMAALALQLVAAVAVAEDDLEHAAEFLGAADALRAAVGAGLEPTEERLRALVVARIGEEPVRPQAGSAATFVDRAAAHVRGKAGFPS